MEVNPDAVEGQPLLTIAIPTHNREAFLRQLLGCLRNEIVGLPEVRLLVSDNASTDGTEYAIQEELRRGTALDYIKNTHNVGPDGNFLQCYERATGKYVWIFSDDDLLRPGTVSTILNHLKREEYDLVFVEQLGFAGDPAAILTKRSRDRALVCKSASDFLRRVHIFTTLISCNIINKSRVEEIGHEPFSLLLNSNLIQLGWTFTALRGHRKSLYIPERHVYYRLENTGGYGVSRVFGPTLANITRKWLAVPRLNNIVINASLQRLLPRFVLASVKKAHGAYAAEDPRAVLSSEFGSNARYWLFIYPLFVLPYPLARLWLQMTRVLNRVDRALGYPSLG